MAANFLEIQDLLQRRADYQARLNLMPYNGTPEIKEQGGNKYLYIRRRIAGKLTSSYVDIIRMNYISCFYEMPEKPGN